MVCVWPIHNKTHFLPNTTTLGPPLSLRSNLAPGDEPVYCKYIIINYFEKKVLKYFNTPSFSKSFTQIHGKYFKDFNSTSTVLVLGCSNQPSRSNLFTISFGHLRLQNCLE